MPSVWEFKDYREFLTAELRERLKRNSSYSLRSFARDLCTTPPRLSEILSGKRKIASRTANKFARALSLTKEDSEGFISLVEFSDAENNDLREIARLRLKRRSPNPQYSLVKNDLFALISHWYHFAIVELTRIKSFQSSHVWIAKQLMITQIEVDHAIERLIRVGLLEKTVDGYRKTESNYSTTQDIPDEAIRSFHRKILKKAGEDLIPHNEDQREFSCNIFAIEKSKLADAKQRLRAFRREFANEYEQTESADAVYALSMQFFNLVKSEGGK